MPDVRSLFLGFYYNFAKLPDEPMQPRMADDRIGYFMTTRFDFTDEGKLTPRVNYINRWRLEKKDPDAALSEPKQPIVFWLDRNIPEKYRATIIAGVLEWNKAFEKIGFKNAIEAKVQPDDADFDTLDARHASIRWMTTARPLVRRHRPVAGRSAHRRDPRRRHRHRPGARCATAAISASSRCRDPSTIAGAAATIPSCSASAPDFAAQEIDFALDVLEARGEIDPDSPEAEQFVLDDLKDMMMHEVGHTLGLRHNFRASTVYTPEAARRPGVHRRPTASPAR